MEVEAGDTKNRKFSDKENLLGDVSRAYKEGLYSDITIILKNNASVSTSKFMLACRVPYFATLLYGGFGDNSASIPFTLDCCDSQIFKLILNFVWEGEIDLSELDIQSLLDLLETARFLCINRLVEGIEDHLEFLLDRKMIEFKDCLIALNFVILNKFTKASSLLLSFIDQNLGIISTLPELAVLTEISIQNLLKFEERISTEIDLFTAFVNWIANKETVSEEVKIEMLGLFDLERFGRSDLVDKVRKTKMFDDTKICDVLEKHLEKLQEKLEEEVKSRERQVKEKEQIIEEQKKKIEETEAGNVDSNSLGTIFDKIWSLDPTHFVNKVEFTFDDSLYLYSYFIKVWDGVKWDVIIESKEEQHTGKQTVHFERIKIRLLKVQVTGSRHIDFPHSPRHSAPTVANFSASLI
eukprot:GFUD01028547.1.p1 GENE.GFUD01028547.1~~GFUD01028547.1.p1  ORF type:complete len:410 (-),score=75.48 GFUD01028547.1:34-1263(-)